MGEHIFFIFRTLYAFSYKVGFIQIGRIGYLIEMLYLGRAAKEHMVKSKLPNAVLGKIWKLSDVDKDGMLDSDEFALANYLINLKLEGLHF